MPTSFSGSGRIRTNIPALNALNTLFEVSSNIANSQLRLSTGKRINSAADDVSGYITSKSLFSRNSSLKTALISAGEAKNVTAIGQDSLDTISTLLTEIKNSAIIASADSLGTDEKVSLAKSAYRLTQQIQFVVDSTVFSGRSLIKGDFYGEWIVGYDANNQILSFDINLKKDNGDFNIKNNNFDLNALDFETKDENIKNKTFAGVEGLDLSLLNNIGENNLGIFDRDLIGLTITSLADALSNVSKVAAYLGGIQNRLTSQNENLNSQITNYTSAISRIEDTDVAEEQLNLSRNFFLETSSLAVLSQANQNPSTYLSLLRN